jgi:hypothetical protein
MKILRILTYSLLMCSIIPQKLVSQELGTGKYITVKGASIGGKAVLKWIPQNPDLYQQGRNLGYQITRVTLTNASGASLPKEVSEATKVVVATAVKPWTIAQWDAHPGRTPQKDSLMKQGFLTETSATLPTGSKLKDAVEYAEKKKNTYIYAALVADSDPFYAKVLGLSYEDATVSPQLSYRYFVSLSNGQSPGSAVVKPISLSELPIPSGLESSVGDKQINITWNADNLDQFYTNFDIFRSDNGGSSFIKVNTEPFLFMGQDEKSSQTLTFADRVDANGIPYTYKVRGLSPYGLEGPFSETITAMARPDRMNMETAVTAVNFIPAGGAQMRWEIIAKENANNVVIDPVPYIDQFDILYRENLEDTATVVNTLPIPNTALQFNIPAPVKQGLYFIRATDIYEYTYTSVPFLAQMKDSIPPVKPVGLTGSIKKDGKIKLSWTANTDTDLLGYKIYISYGRKNPFTQVTSDHVKGTEYRTEIKPDNANDTIYYKISAVDQRYNISKYSDSIYLLIPDRNPPSDPVLKRVTPTQNGVRVSWALSSSPDIEKHYLQRRFSSATKWTNIITITPTKIYPPLPLLPDEFEAANYIDIDSLALRDYDYRMMAIDTAGNESISSVVTIRPYDDGKRGLIRPFVARLVPLGAVYNPTASLPQPYTSIPSFFPDITDLNDPKTFASLDPNGPPVKPPYKRAKTNVVRLEWGYETKLPSSIAAFQIYQKKPSSTVGNLSNTLANDPPYILIKTINVSDAKRMATMNNLTNYTVFVEDIPGRKEVTTPVEYKIIALHIDGGFSLPVFSSITLPPITF